MAGGGFLTAGLTGKVSHRERRVRRRRMWLVFGAVVLCVSGAFLVLALRRGFGRLLRFLTVPSLEAKSGRRYTPGGAVKRYMEKQSEKKSEE